MNSRREFVSMTRAARSGLGAVMGSKRVKRYCVSRKRLLMVEFGLAARVARKVVAAHYGARFTDAIAVEGLKFLKKNWA